MNKNNYKDYIKNNINKHIDDIFINNTSKYYFNKNKSNYLLLLSDIQNNEYCINKIVRKLLYVNPITYKNIHNKTISLPKDIIYNVLSLIVNKFDTDFDTDNILTIIRFTNVNYEYVIEIIDYLYKNHVVSEYKQNNFLYIYDLYLIAGIYYKIDNFNIINFNKDKSYISTPYYINKYTKCIKYFKSKAITKKFMLCFNKLDARLVDYLIIFKYTYALMYIVKNNYKIINVCKIIKFLFSNKKYDAVVKIYSLYNNIPLMIELFKSLFKLRNKIKIDVVVKKILSNRKKNIINYKLYKDSNYIIDYENHFDVFLSGILSNFNLQINFKDSNKRDVDVKKYKISELLFNYIPNHLLIDNIKRFNLTHCVSISQYKYIHDTIINAPFFFHLQLFNILFKSVMTYGKLKKSIPSYTKHLIYELNYFDFCMHNIHKISFDENKFDDDTIINNIDNTISNNNIDQFTIMKNNDKYNILEHYSTKFIYIHDYYITKFTYLPQVNFGLKF